ncbi:peptidoglycan-binding protein [Aurantimonas sp. MSK8Z-1]|nr:peptidoglycan-binding protein [Aurantimonas sp. MSK8Z-1]
MAGGAVAARPALSGGMAAFALMAAAITGNAFFAQPGRHPKPMLVTRLDAAQAGTTQTATAQPADDGAPVPIVVETQTALARLGLYDAPIDGRPGPRTSAAISRFQTANALPVDGQATPRLLSTLQAALAPAASGTQYASAETGVADDRTGAIRGGATSAASDTLDPAIGAEVDGLPQDELVRRIQEALASAGVAPLKADGIAGRETRTAIATFEALEGMDVTGAPRPRILKRLISVGAAE